MFYKLDSLDPLGSNPWKRSDNPHMNTTFGGDLNKFARIVQFIEPDIKLRHEDKVEDEDATESKIALQAQLVNAEDDEESWFEWPNLLPDGYVSYYSSLSCLELLLTQTSIATVMGVCFILRFFFTKLSRSESSSRLLTDVWNNMTSRKVQKS